MRAPVRRAAFGVAPRAAARASVRSQFRKYATESAPTPQPKSGGNTWLYASIGGAAVASLGYYFYATSSDTSREAQTAAKSAAQSAKALAGFTPSKEDYQKVCKLGNFPLNFIA